MNHFLVEIILLISMSYFDASILIWFNFLFLVDIIRYIREPSGFSYMSHILIFQKKINFVLSVFMPKMTCQLIVLPLSLAWVPSKLSISSSNSLNPILIVPLIISFRVGFLFHWTISLKPPYLCVFYQTMEDLQ